MCECYICGLSVDTCLSEINYQGFSLLLGNGFLQAHPDGKLLEFNICDIYNQLKRIYRNFYKSNLDKGCPETFLQFVRIEFSYAILQWYQEKLVMLKHEKHFSNQYLHDFREYVQKFNNLFTLNYDPITYRSIFNDQEAKFSDGFNPYGKVSEEDIKNRIGSSKGLYYLHGAFHLIYCHDSSSTPKHSYRKIQAKSESLIDEIIKNYEEILNYWKYHTNLGYQESNSYEDAFCVLESKSLYKKIWICNDPYLRLCYKRLGKQDRILSVGCSFKFDDHILERILRNPNLECLYIGIYSEQDQKNICSAYKRISESPMNATYMKRLEKNIKKIKFVCTKKLSQLIWPSVS